ncbi:Os01g0300400 [Oryza sativa Japonica Group]|uniref:ATP-dependent DNA helicase n=1 Tax=Oryza sativa subsp. japonica TaxID=39947 RepID=C7IX34_ORYSJ|nr:Os01g0300400 [Oryza sativa Japonica Group]|eukprot:NP_001172292.1 Os01g0300400 [Oryza sativa Japonica Group]
MAENSSKNPLVLDECIVSASCPSPVQSILCDPGRKRKVPMLDQQSKEPDLAILVYIKGAFCAGQFSQTTPFVPNVCRDKFVSTFNLPSRRAVRHRLMFGSDNAPNTTSDSSPGIINLISGGPTLAADETFCGLPRPQPCVAAESRRKRKAAMIHKRGEKLCPAIYSPSSRSVWRRIIPNDNVVRQQCHTQLQQQNLSSASHQDPRQPFAGRHQCFVVMIIATAQLIHANGAYVWGGSVHLAPYKPPPEPLLSLLTGQNPALSAHFFDNIRRYNSMFAMRSMGLNIIGSINDGGGPYVFKISGQLCHWIGSLIPRDGARPEYCQLYIFYTENEVQNRMEVPCISGGFKPNENVISSLMRMFDDHNPIVQVFRTARDRLSDQSEDRYYVKLFVVPNQHGGVYSAPVASEVVGLVVVNDLGTTNEGCDLIIQDKASHLQRIKESHCKFMAMQYPLLFPYGEDGFHKDLRFGCPHLFITLTCNASWSEITQALALIPRQHSSDRLDIVDRVFQMKLRIFIDDITKYQFFGPISGVVYTIEFQKRGLPHVHIIVWLEKDGPLDVDWIDAFISAQLPDPSVDRIGYEASPSLCSNRSSPCMNDGKCMGVLYMLGQITTLPQRKVGVDVDNNYVVAHNVDLLVKYQAHINVEIVNRDGMEKYLFKYSTKGPDYAKIGIRDNVDLLVKYQAHINVEIVNCDGMEKYLFKYSGMEKYLFKYSTKGPGYAKHTYVEFPEFWTWHADGKYWKQRSQSHKGKVGRIANVGPNQGERFYLRILLHVIKGAQFFSDVRIVGGIQYPTFQSACEAMGLLGDDHEWSHAITDAAQWALPYQLRQLFVMMLLFCQVSDPAKLFDNHVQLMGEDFAYRVSQHTPGKTFLWNTLLANIRNKGKIVLAVASSGIVALLLPGGRTPHSRFRIPLDIQEDSMCAIKKNTHLAELIQQTSLIIWDEASVNHRHFFEAFDRTLRDIMSSINHDLVNMQFGGITVVLDGDFRQTLPVIPNARKQQILNASITRSRLWKNCVVLELTENMRLNCPTFSQQDKFRLELFATWLLSLGDGVVHDSAPTDRPDATWVEIPSYLLLPAKERNLACLISFVYDSIPHLSQLPTYLCEHAILAPTNEITAAINAQIISHTATEEMSYYSFDTIDDATPNYCNVQSLYPAEFLNTVHMSGLPDHHLQLKIGVPIMLLRNLDPSKGLCNGTHLIVT